jgi:hypothetical protein
VTLTERAAALLLDAVRHGQVAEGQAISLARDWLAATGGDAALRVLVGGEHEAARVIELCRVVIATFANAPVGARERR